METMDLKKLPELSRTMLIPLAVRAGEAARKHPVVSDAKAAEILGKLDTSGLIVDGGGISTHGILARTAVLDEEIGRLLAERPEAAVVNLGAGLDTRFFRLDNGKVRWYELDLPEVISLRRRLLPETERCRYLAGSVLDREWTEKIDMREEEPVTFLAEGLLMYFPEEKVREVLEILTGSFPNGDLFFDAVHSSFIGKRISSDFLWGIDEVREVERLNSRVKTVACWSTGSLLKNRQPPLLRLLNRFPSTRNRSRVIHLQWREGGDGCAAVQ